MGMATEAIRVVVGCAAWLQRITAEPPRELGLTRIHPGPASARATTLGQLRRSSGSIH